MDVMGPLGVAKALLQNQGAIVLRARFIVRTGLRVWGCSVLKACGLPDNEDKLFQPFRSQRFGPSF
eukprot:8967739-Pyramimonas_sp.AAC.1